MKLAHDIERELVSLDKAPTLTLFGGVRLAVVEMNVASNAEPGEVGMRQSATGSVEWRPVAVFRITVERDFDVG